MVLAGAGAAGKGSKVLDEHCVTQITDHVSPQAAEKDVKVAGKLLGQLVMAQDSEERADVMDTLEYKVQTLNASPT
jgi:imidazoleglycerol phosphate synthase glutamine amidotransferase subunit HisH